MPRVCTGKCLSHSGRRGHLCCQHVSHQSCVFVDIVGTSTILRKWFVKISSSNCMKIKSHILGFGPVSDAGTCKEVNVCCCLRVRDGPSELWQNDLPTMLRSPGRAIKQGCAWLEHRCPNHAQHSRCNYAHFQNQYLESANGHQWLFRFYLGNRKAGYNPEKRNALCTVAPRE